MGQTTPAMGSLYLPQYRFANANNWRKPTHRTGLHTGGQETTQIHSE